MAPSPPYESAAHDAAARATALYAARRQQAQLALLAGLDCLAGVPQTDLVRLAELGVLHVCGAETTIVSEQTRADSLYLVLAGTVSLALHESGGREVLVAVLGRGDCFGEAALFDESTPPVAARALSSCQVLRIARDRLRARLPEMPALARVLRAAYRRRLIDSSLARVPIFNQLLHVDRLQLAQALEARTYARDELIIRAGETGRALFLIERGQVIIEQNGAAVAQLDPGDFFGEIALIERGAHMADVRAQTAVELLALPAAVFHELRCDHPELNARLEEIADTRRASADARRTQPERAAQVAVAIGRGLLRGRHVIARDMELCDPACTLCAQACTDRHGHARIDLAGPELGTIQLTESCRQCRVAPECVAACPEHAIEWNTRGALIITDRCTGCGACVAACPYDAVTRVPLPRAPRALFAQLRSQFVRPGREAIALEPTQRADKCDLCHGHNDMACISACPTGALRLIAVDELRLF